MARITKKAKPLIYVFCEGESEQAYTKFLKETFSDYAVIKPPKSTGLFEYAKNIYSNDVSYKDSAEITDEIWFFFDVEADQRDKWNKRLTIIRHLRNLRKPEKITVRLLMTTACIEYWLLLHFEKCAPSIETKPDKEGILHRLEEKESSYKKGDYTSTSQIAKRYPQAVINAKAVLEELLQDGLPELNDSDERNRWLYTCSKTFSTVFEAIEYLETLII